MGCRWAEPFSSQLIQLIKYEALSDPWDDFSVQVIRSLQSVVIRKVQAEGSILVHVDFRRGRDWRTCNPNPWDPSVLILNKNLISWALHVRCDLTDAFQSFVLAVSTAKTRKKFLD